MESKEGDLRQCIYIKKPGGLPRSAVLPVSLLPVFNFFYKNNKSEPMTNRYKVRIILFCQVASIRIFPRSIPRFLKPQTSAAFAV